MLALKVQVQGECRLSAALKVLVQENFKSRKCIECKCRPTVKVASASAKSAKTDYSVWARDSSDHVTSQAYRSLQEVISHTTYIARYASLTYCAAAGGSDEEPAAEAEAAARVEAAEATSLACTVGRNFLL